MRGNQEKEHKVYIQHALWSRLAQNKVNIKKCEGKVQSLLLPLIILFPTPRLVDLGSQRALTLSYFLPFLNSIGPIVSRAINQGSQKYTSEKKKGSNARN